MNSKEYEEFVEKTLNCLNFFKNANIYRNLKYPGIRQPGEYEIDIACEMIIENMSRITIIIECKNHSRPITRPIVQNFHQTKEAINAHKAAIASPVGFTSEAIEVARDLGISLWVITKDKPFEMVLANDGMKVTFLSEEFNKLYIQYLNVIGIATKDNVSTEYKLVMYPSDNIVEDNKEKECFFSLRTRVGTAFFLSENHAIYYKSSAIREIIEFVLEGIKNSHEVENSPSFKSWVRMVDNSLIGWIPSSRKDRSDYILSKAQEALKRADWEEFYKLF
ncbi:restriction endonuclease [Paenibacillus sp.]|uniref:restriction endonuclease n=1 Tax=Paenibacillus sp. TaxID=58172 RepID=UPI002812701B|nr:restriction endonuclease [Paenibacillus sp.]